MVWSIHSTEMLTKAKEHVFYGLHRHRHFWFALESGVNALVAGRSLLVHSFLYLCPTSLMPLYMLTVGKLRNGDWMLISGQQVIDVNKHSGANGGDSDC